MDVNDIIEKHRLWLAGESGGSHADLRGADLRGADLRGADLRGADLRGADLRGAVLRGAVLRGADLWSTVGNKAQIKSLQIEEYDITYTKDVMQIGCQRHDLADWWAFSDEEIDRMDRGGALTWWRKWKLILRGIVEGSPAE